jgi:hypothetical protein
MVLDLRVFIENEIADFFRTAMGTPLMTTDFITTSSTNKTTQVQPVTTTTAIEFPDSSQFYPQYNSTVWIMSFVIYYSE